MYIAIYLSAIAVCAGEYQDPLRLPSDHWATNLGLPSDLPAWDCLGLSVHNTPGTVFFTENWSLEM